MIVTMVLREVLQIATKEVVRDAIAQVKHQTNVSVSMLRKMHFWKPEESA